MKTKIVLSLAIGVAAIAMMQCGPDDKPTDNNPEPVSVITPVDLPTNIVPGFNFPEDSMKIYSWLNAGTGVDTFKLDSIYQHVWGLWAGLTARTNEIYGGDTLLVFETWPGINEIRRAMMRTDSVKVDISKSKTSRTPLNVPRQFVHASLLSGNQDTTIGNNVFETVSYNLSAAEYALSRSIFMQDTLNKYYHPNQIGAIPPFPAAAITLKPNYFAGKPDGNLIRIPVWHGPPDTAKGYGSSAWGTYVFADTTNSQQPGKALTPVNISASAPAPTQAQIDAATCNLSDFIYFEMDAEMAAYVDSTAEGGATFVAGDVAILVAMHVATKEISNWTWQTFYWDPNPSAPNLPGTNMSKPTQITGAPAHYSAVHAYAMLAPLQPISGGKNDPSFKSVIGYNPYLEAHFDFRPLNPPNRYNPAYQYGVQTNCMSCHAMATINPSGTTASYTTDQYIDMSDESYFKNLVQLDFAWSIQGNIIPATTAAKK
jgi:hypothetical protein